MKIIKRDKVKPQGLCKVCKEPKADLRVHVAFTIMRGDDEVYKVHTKCFNKFRQDYEL